MLPCVDRCDVLKVAARIIKNIVDIDPLASNLTKPHAEIWKKLLMVLTADCRQSSWKVSWWALVPFSWDNSSTSTSVWTWWKCRIVAMSNNPHGVQFKEDTFKQVSLRLATYPRLFHALMSQASVCLVWPWCESFISEGDEKAFWEHKDHTTRSVESKSTTTKWNAT